MPTGYTERVRTGKITEFKDFALSCAKAFGPCITLKDCPEDFPIPDEFQPNSYYEDELIAAQTELAKLKAMTEEEKVAAVIAHNKEEKEDYEKYAEKKQQELYRYTTMLESVKAWDPPTPDHKSLKDFMMERLQTSIKYDCEVFWDEPVDLDVETWYNQEVRKLEKRIEDYTKLYDEEVKRVDYRNKWIRELRGSLG